MEVVPSANTTREENIVKIVSVVGTANMGNSSVYAMIVKVLDCANMGGTRLNAKIAGVVKFANMEEEKPAVKIVMEVKYVPTAIINTYVKYAKRIYAPMVSLNIYVQIVTVREFVSLDQNHIIQDVGVMVTGN